MNSCSNCAFFEEIRHRGQKYRKGKCKFHKMSRIPDGYESFLSVSDPDNFHCSEHKLIHVHSFYMNTNGDVECFDENCEFFMDKSQVFEILAEHLRSNTE